MVNIMKSKLSIDQRKSVKYKASKRNKRSLRSRIALVLLSLIAFGSFVLLVLPYLPRLSFLLTKPRIDPSSYRQAAQATKDGANANNQDNQPGNRLVLPDIGVNTEIIDGRDIYVIGKNQGVWRETRNIDPTQDGNIVIAGHRFLYTATNGGWFYNLPELKNGQKIYVRWNEKVYEYEVYNSKTVLPTQVDIRDTDPAVPKKLTLYTCYPLGSTAKRFVIEARQI
jgi:sortase A